MTTLLQAVSMYTQVDRSAFTNTNYRRILGALARSIGPDRDIRLITYPDLADYVQRLHTGRKASTVAQHARVMRQLFAWCVKLGLIETNPASAITVRIPRKDPGKTRAIPTDVLTAMIAAADVRDRALLLFLAETGCRLGGVRTLTLSHLDMNRNCALLHEKGDNYYWAYFGPLTADALRAYLAIRPKSDSDAVFIGQRSHRALARETVGFIVASLSKAVCGRAYRPHSIRHWVAEQWVQAGEQPNMVQHKLGHRSIQTTLNNYYPRVPKGIAEATQRHELAAKLVQQTEPAKSKIIAVDFAAG